MKSHSLYEYDASIDVEPNSQPTTTGRASGGSLEREQYGLFVKFFRQASPYIEGHRGRSFVIAVPGEVVDRQDVLDTLLQDVALLHGLGVHLVVVVGARMQINEAIRAKGSEPQYAKGYRVTDDVAMKAAVSAAGAARMMVEARLSKAPTITMMRRHARGSSAARSQAPTVTTVSGNYVAAKRKGYSASGEPLNCDIYSVAVRAAIDLNADKLIVVAPPGGDPTLDMLPAWLPLQEAENLLLNTSRETIMDGRHASDTRAPSLDHGSDEEAFKRAEDELDFDTWYELGLPMPLLAACMVCKAGVKRAHLIDASIDGALLLELYSTDVLDP
eukprot:jgi/Picre1/32165/NNA_007511.t1